MTELKWGLFAPCINEIELTRAKLEWALERFDDISIVEGHHPKYTNVSESGLSVDGTTEILEGYADRIKYTPLGKVDNEMILRDVAYKKLNKNLDVVVMCDMDEFYLDKDLDFIDDDFQESETGLSWDGCINNVPTTITLKFPRSIGHCHAHVWWSE